jgi:prepilin-type N-terminal cleavage/methylation domain-containing protein
MINKVFIKIKKRGFTLIETLVAVLILAVAIAGPLTIASKGLNTALTAKDQITAFYLAQDAVEYIRAVRDTNNLCISGNASNPGNCTTVSTWLQGLDQGNGCTSTDGSATCYLDSTQAPSVGATSCGGTTCPVICYDPSTLHYTYAGGGSSCTSSGYTNTIYTRTIAITCQNISSGTCTSNEVVLTVTVSWNDPAAHSVVVHENLFNWQK